MQIKSGYAAILGKPNVGKSTLLNKLLKQKLSIITDKPQTTRKRILGILSEESYQIVFFDTPGILEPNYLLQSRMMDFVRLSASDADIIIFIIDISDDPDGEKTLSDPYVSEILKKSRRKKIAIINKIDLSSGIEVKKLADKLASLKVFQYVIPISALLPQNLDLLLSALLELLPEHPKYYPDEFVAAENERFFVGEIIREKIFEFYKEEVPYSSEVRIIEFKERKEGKDYILAEIFVEKESQKGIIIGSGAKALKKLGQAAREAVEDFLGRAVYLELKVKVKRKWRTDEKSLDSFGYSTDQ